MTTETKAAAPHNFDAALKSSVLGAAAWLVAHQRPDGHWVGRAESNSCMEAQ